MKKRMSGWLAMGALVCGASLFSCHDFAEVKFGTHPDAAADADGGLDPACAPPATQCPTACVPDTQSDPLHCGSDCKVCPAAGTAGQVAVCRLGSCGYDCAAPGQILVDGHCFPAPASCTGLTDRCGDKKESCCEFAPRIVGGQTFNRSWDTSNMSQQVDGTSATPTPISGWQKENGALAVVSSFYLDRFEVTIGRFRKFAETYDTFLLTHPNSQIPDGKHASAINGGWRKEWSGKPGFYAPSTAALKKAIRDCSAVVADALEGTAEDTRPMTCVSWYEAFLFCIGDDARLPTEAEWNFAAAAGAEQRAYPWGTQLPLSVPPAFGKIGQGGGFNPDPVGSHPMGAGLWGHLDLAGNAWEFVHDTCTTADSYEANNATDPLTVIAGSDYNRIARGGSFRYLSPQARTAYRQMVPEVGSPTYTAVRLDDLGWRCARSATP